MSERRPRKKGAPIGDRVVRRARSERRGLDPDLEALARGETDRLKPPRPNRGPRLRDPRPVALIPGVANRDARAVFDARVAVLREAARTGDEAALGRGLLEAVLLRLWRGRSVTSLEALAQDVVGLSLGELPGLIDRYALELRLRPEPCSDPVVATWLRAEAALLEAGLLAQVGLCAGEPSRLELRLAADDAPVAFDVLGRKMRPLVQDRSR